MMGKPMLIVSLVGTADRDSSPSLWQTQAPIHSAVNVGS